VADELYPVIDVSDWDIVADETSGAGAKYWLVKPGTEERWLFKTVTVKDGHVHGENWAEKAVSHLADLVNVSRATVEMAEYQGTQGCISADLRPAGYELQPGQVLLEQCQARGYVHQSKGKWHPGHSLENIRMALEGALPPPDCELPFNATAFDMFAGYLVLDAWVANRDRHDNNWAVLRPIGQSADPLRLCGSYDHASSLGFNVTDEERSRRLAEPEGLGRWCRRGYADRFEEESGRRLTLVDLAARALGLCSEAAREHWLGQLERLQSTEVGRILVRVPRMSEPARSFANKVLDVNRRRLLDACA
jgi:hypothetical protein